MENTYIVSKWALIRRNELVDIPHKYEIHPDFLCDISCDEFKEAFTQIHDMFYQLYTDMASEPERFGCPLYRLEEHAYFSKEAISFIDKVLTEKGYSVGRGDGNEGPSLRYYKGKSVYDFALTSVTGNLLLELRIRNAENCMEYLQKCPERIVDMFRYSNQGCDNRANGTCKYGVKYEFEHEEKWHCGCCGAPFTIYPVKEDISYYIRLVELGNKRQKFT